MTEPMETPPATRLVIRIKLAPREAPPPTSHLRRNAVLLILAAMVSVLGWFAISALRSERSSSVAAIETPSNTRDEVLPSKPVAPTLPTKSMATESSPSAITEVLPEVPQSALQTIRGTVKVSVRVTLDERGSVIDATANDRGPSRYFERLAIAAAKHWTFTPSTSEARRMMQLRFEFTRAGVAAASSQTQ